jgi:hypothetical protein
MKKHVVWLLLLALILTTAVAVAASEPANDAGTFSAVGNLTPVQGTGGGCTIGTWTAVDSLTTPRSRPAAAYSSATGLFYVLGGEATGGNRDIPIEEYDSGSDLWTDQTNLLTGVGAYIYVPGGWDGVAGQTTMQRYDPVANSVLNMAALPGGVAAHAVTAIGTDIYVLAGSSTGAAGTTNYIYDTVGNSWSTGAALPTAVQYPAAASDGTYVYVLGGNTTNLTTVQRYDPIANSWTPIASMGTGRGGPGAFFDGQNIWAIAGGWATYLTSTEYWDGVAWNPGPTLNTGVRTVGAAFGNGVGMKAGGWNGAYSGVAETIDIDCGGPGPAPSIVMTKTVGLDPNSCAATSSISVPAGGGGTTVGYCYTVMNTGAITVSTHDLVDSELGTIFTGLNYDLGPGASVDTVTAGQIVSAVITQTTTNVATWTAYVDTAVFTTSVSAATVTVNAPTSVDLSGFSDGSVGTSPVAFIALVVLLAGIGAFIYRRRIA